MFCPIVTRERVRNMALGPGNFWEFPWTEEHAVEMLPKISVVTRTVL